MTCDIYSIEGNIGSGKSTLVNMLKIEQENNKNIVFMDEPVCIWESIKDKEGTNIIEKFYGNTQKYAFSFQMMAYISRISMLKDIIKKHPGKTIICERSVYTDKNVFAKMLYDCGDIEDVNYQIYMKWFDEFVNDLNINGLIYVRAEPETSYKRVVKRNRKGETIPLEYLQKCHNYHDTWIYNEKDVNIIILDANDDKRECDNDYVIWFKKINEFIKINNKYVKNYEQHNKQKQQENDYLYDNDLTEHIQLLNGS